MNGLVHEIDTRDADFKKNTNGYDYKDREYARHVAYYEDVQDLLYLARRAYEDNGCDWTDNQAELLVHFHEAKNPDPLGHPGHKPHKSLFQQIVDNTTIRIPFIPFPIPNPVEVG